MSYLMSRFINLFLVFATIHNSSAACSDNLRRPEGHVALFVLGDSLYDPGNNNYIDTTTEYQANFFPYGKSFFDPPSGRFSDGRLIPDFISEYANFPLIPPYLKPGIRNYEHGVNFASGGAGALVESHQGFAVDLKTQLRYFKEVQKQLRKKLGAKKANALISSAVYLFSIGGNDYLSPFTFNSSLYDQYSKKEYVGMVFGNLTQVVEGIYKIGGRNFGFATLVPLGCLPGTKLLQPGNTGACFKEANLLAKMHNKELPKSLKLILSKLKGFNYTVYDFYRAMTTVLENPSEFGFKEAKMGCCGSGQYRGVYSCGGKRGVKEYELCEVVGDYFFFDSFHPTEKAYEHFAAQLWSGNSDVIKPYNLKAFFEQTDNVM